MRRNRTVSPPLPLRCMETRTRAVTPPCPAAVESPGRSSMQEPSPRPGRLGDASALVSAGYISIMTGADEVVALLSDPRHPATFSARYRIWNDHRRSEAASHAVGHLEPGARRLPGQLGETEIYLSIWRAEPDRVRVEIGGGLQDGSVGVRVGERWWSTTPAQGTPTNADSPAHTRWFGEGAESFLDPDALLTSLRFQDRGHDDRAGRPVVVAAAFPSGGQRAVPPVLGKNADRYLVEVDLDCGLVLPFTPTSTTSRCRRSMSWSY